MKPKFFLLNLAALLLLPYGLQAADVNYTFAGLTPGLLTDSTTPGAAGNQDGWYSDSALSGQPNGGALNVAANGGPYSGAGYTYGSSNVVESNSPGASSAGFRAFSAPFFTATSGVFTVNFTLGANSTSVIAALAGNGSSTALNNNSGTGVFSPLVEATGVSATGFTAGLAILTSASARTTTSASVTGLLTGHAYSLQLQMNFTANGGDGSGTLYYQDLTTGGPLTAVSASLTNIDLGLEYNTTGYKYNNWNQVRLRQDASNSSPDFSPIEGFSITNVPELRAQSMATIFVGLLVLRAGWRRYKQTA